MSRTAGVAEEARNYWSRRAATYDESPWHTCCRSVWARLVSSILPRGSRAVDLGTGTGFIASILAERYSHVVGVDVSPEMLRRARARLWREAGPVADLVEADAASLPFRGGSADVLFARHVLWALHDPLAALREAARCAKLAAFTFSTRMEPPSGYEAPETPLRWVREPGEVLAAARKAGVEAYVVEASWIRAEQAKEIGRRPPGETGYYVLIVRKAKKP